MIYINELLRQVPSDTENVVNATRARFNSTIRQMLRQETGLRFGGGKNGEDDFQEGHSVRVFVEPGVPEELESLRLDEDMWLAILLAPWRSELTKLKESSNIVNCELIDNLPSDISRDGQFSSIRDDLRTVENFSESLLRIAKSIELVKMLHAIDDDILGQYIWRGGGLSQTTASIKLYWGVIGLIARSLNISVPGLTVKVLAHELAHAFTHLGADIDGHRWDDVHFSKTERAVKEGLAQYYTRQIVHRLKDRMPEAEEAYRILWPEQPFVYQIQENWVEAGFSPEHVRLAMVKFRRVGATTLADFELFLGNARAELGTKMKSGAID